LLYYQSYDLPRSEEKAHLFHIHANEVLTLCENNDVNYCLTVRAVEISNDTLYPDDVQQCIAISSVSSMMIHCIERKLLIPVNSTDSSYLDSFCQTFWGSHWYHFSVSTSSVIDEFASYNVNALFPQWVVVHVIEKKTLKVK